MSCGHETAVRKVLPTSSAAEKCIGRQEWLAKSGFARLGKARCVSFMTPFFIAFIMAAGVSAWVYDKTQQRTGNNTSSSVQLAAIVGVIVFIVTLTLLSFVDSIIE